MCDWNNNAVISFFQMQIRPDKPLLLRLSRSCHQQCYLKFKTHFILVTNYSTNQQCFNNIGIYIYHILKHPHLTHTHVQTHIQPLPHSCTCITCGLTEKQHSPKDAEGPATGATLTTRSEWPHGRLDGPCGSQCAGLRKTLELGAKTHTNSRTKTT